MSAPARLGLQLAVSATVIAIFITLYVCLSGFTATDSFISFRYAHNWVNGNGIVFNHGERVEGYTNFLWIALTALLHFIPRTLETREYLLPAVKTLAFFFPLGIIIILMTCVKNIRDRFLSTLFLVLAPGFILWSVSGMETVAFALLVLVSCFLVIREETTRWGALAIGLVFILTVMMRPEGLLFVFLGFCWLVVKKDKKWSCVALTAVVFFLGFSIYTFWRTWYFGHLLPNTFYAKVGGSGSQIVRGAGYFLRWGGSLLYLPLIPVVLNLRKIKLGEPKLLISISCIVYCAYVIVVGGDWMNDFRFFVPILPLIAWSYVLFVESIKSKKAQYICSVLCLIVISMNAVNIKNNLKKYSIFSLQKERNESEYIIAEWFNRTSCENALIAMGNLGRFNFYSDLPVVDTIGLVDTHIARIKKKDFGKSLTGHEKQDPEYVLSRRPVYFFQMDVLLTSVDKKKKTSHVSLGESTIQYLTRESKEFKRGYEKRKVTYKGVPFDVYVRKDSLNCLYLKVSEKLSTL